MSFDNTSSTDLAALLCSRLCHDMLSPVGALNNGLELLADESDPTMRENCIDLLEQSARTSADKLKFFRLAFGAAGGFGEMVDSAEPRALIDALAAANPRLKVNWALSDAKLPKPAIKVLLNLAQIGMDSLVRGGTLDIGAEIRIENGHCNTEIVVRASGPRIALDETIGRALDGSLRPGELTSRTAAAHMIALLAEEAGGGLQYRLGEDSLVLGAVLPAPEGLIG